MHNSKISTFSLRIFKEIVLCCFLAATLAAEDQRPTKKKDDRGKRNLEYQISHHYPGSHSYRLDRRIATGPQHPLYPPPHLYPGPPRPYTQYHKGRPNSYPVPPYAVQMEPLVHYSQRDPLYDINIFPLNADSSNALGREDLLTENNHVQEKVYQESHAYGAHQPQIVERPVYIKEPEPIIEIIIKESNVTLPPPPTVPPQKKKKEQVQVFYVKYKKNPHGSGKDSVIYDKPVPAISPKIPDEEEEEHSSYDYHHETATLPPPPSTTLRTIIKPDSEVYHSPSGVKVTFGKEGFDYEKRSSKPEEYPLQPGVPQGRQLSSFSNTYFKRPFTNTNFQSPPPGFRQPQPYKPFSFPSPPTLSNYKPSGRQTSSQYTPQPKFPSFQQPSFSSPSSQQYSNLPGSRPPAPKFSHSISHPAPPHFQSPRPSHSPPRQPVAYKPFDNLRPQQPQQQFIQLPQNQVPTHLNPTPNQPQVHFRPETHFPSHQQLPLSQQTHTFNPTRAPQHLPQVNTQLQYRQEELSQSKVQQSEQPQQQIHYQQQTTHNHFKNQVPQNQQSISQNEHLNNIQTAQSIIPAGGQLIPSLPKYEQHISEVHSAKNQNNQGLSSQEFEQKILEQFNGQGSSEENYQPNSQQQLLKQKQQIQQILNQQRQQQQEQSRTAQQYYQEQQRNLQNGVSHTTPRAYFQEATRRTTNYVSNTPRIAYQTTTTRPTTTTQEPEKPSTTTKDPKILEAQLPDEVPDELREQLLSSGILNNAQISILDYDKVGDIPLSALPPEQLANFYGAGGGAQISAGSAPEPTFLRSDGSQIEERLTSPVEEESEDDQQPDASEIQEVKAVAPPGVEMKVVRYDPETNKGQSVQESYVEHDAQQLDPVVLNDNAYSRYLPLKVNGTQFPIPDVPELRGKKISSVVVLAPVTYDFSSGRKTRDTIKSDEIDLIQGEDLKKLLEDPTLENYKKFLRGARTRPEVISNRLSFWWLTTILPANFTVVSTFFSSQNSSNKEKEIFMYDVATQTVSKLSGELSSAFVEAAEANSDDEEIADKAADSNVVESRVPFTGEIDRQDVDREEADFSASASEYLEVKKN
ncbi:hypothetical protein NQ317_010832 [Molorchus minor]|uniref:Uncharacterized protein n=1 Tax=Molorchus minor TaxID=1323400 RepID=A0ABQ9JN45_9CUCU|nr:hypothetical protein NQ317_010832 [Molorchus minor]